MLTISPSAISILNVHGRGHVTCFNIKYVILLNNQVFMWLRIICGFLEGIWKGDLQMFLFLKKLIKIFLISFLKEYCGQYSVLIKMHNSDRNEKLCEIYFKNLCFQNVFAFIDLFYRYHYIRYFICLDCMLRHACTVCTEAATGGVP